jgi:hypothetical protein
MSMASVLWTVPPRLATVGKWPVWPHSEHPQHARISSFFSVWRRFPWSWDHLELRLNLWRIETDSIVRRSTKRSRWSAARIAASPPPSISGRPPDLTTNSKPPSTLATRMPNARSVRAASIRLLGRFVLPRRPRLESILHGKAGSNNVASNIGCGSLLPRGSASR